MSRQYKRSIEVIIGDKESTNIPNAIKITGLRVKFHVEKDIIGTPNPGRVSIWNLNRDSRAKIENKYTKIVVNAGYDDNRNLLMAGEIIYVFDRKVGPNIITEIYVEDGKLAYIDSFFTKTYTDIATYDNIINDVAKSFDGLTIGTIKDVPKENNSIYGSTFFDLSHNVMDKLTNSLDLTWYVHNEEINVMSKDGSINNDIIVFNALNGMIDSPVITELGINLNTLLRPTLKPGSNFKVESISADIQLSNYYFKDLAPTKGVGTYRIDKIIHVGDTHDSQWNTYIEGFILL